MYKQKKTLFSVFFCFIVNLFFNTPKDRVQLQTSIV